MLDEVLVVQIKGRRAFMGTPELCTDTWHLSKEVRYWMKT
jgi:hypothetical protein